MEAGYTLPVVAARGPLALAVFFRGLTPFMMDLMDNPPLYTNFWLIPRTPPSNGLKPRRKQWATAWKAYWCSTTLWGSSRESTIEEFAHPYLQKVFSSFPASWVKVYHNDARIDPFVENLADVGFDVLMDVQTGYQ